MLPLLRTRPPFATPTPWTAGAALWCGSRALFSSSSSCSPGADPSVTGPADTTGLRFIFLEGSAATAKSTLCKRLAKMGYQVHLEEYVSMCKQYPFVAPTSAAMSMVWGARLVQHMLDMTTLHQRDPSAIRDGVVFMDRSLLTPGIYGRAAQSQSLAYWEEIAGAVDQAFRCTYVLCETEDATQRERLLGRLEYHSKDGEDTIRRKLGEADLHFLDCVNKQYQRLQREKGIFSFKIPTTDPKQAVYILLKKLELPFRIAGFEDLLPPVASEGRAPPDPMVDDEFLRP